MALFDFLKFTPKPQPRIQQQYSVKGLMKTGMSQDEAKTLITGMKLENARRQTPMYNVKESILGDDQITRDIKLGHRPAQTLDQYTKNAFNLSGAMVSLWTHAVTNRREFLLLAYEVAEHPLIARMITLICDDVLNKDPEGEVLAFVSDDKVIQEELDALFEAHDFNFLVADLLPELLILGEYSLRLEVSAAEGVTQIVDDLDPINIIAFYDQSRPARFLHLYKEQYVIEPPHKIAHFIMNDRKQRVAVQNLLSPEYKIADKSKLPPAIANELPDYVRVGRPLFMGVYPKLRELQMLDVLIPATKLNQITQSQIVGVKVPANTDTEKVMEILDQYDNLLNVPIGLDKVNERITISEVLTVSGKIRCVPYFDDGKGAIEPINARQNQNVDDILHAVKDIREIITTSIGVPPSLLFGSADKEKSQEVRLFSGYTRKLASIQESLRRGLKQIITVHLVNRGYADISQKDFDVKFLQPLTDIAGLENAELNDAKQELAGRTLDFVNKMMSNTLLAPYINVENVREWVKAKFNSLTDGLNLFNDEPDQNILAQQAAAKSQQLRGDFAKGDQNDPSKDPSNPEPQVNIDDFASGEDPNKDQPTFGLDSKV